MVYFKSMNVIIYSKASPTYGIQIQKSYPVSHKNASQTDAESLNMIGWKIMDPSDWLTALPNR